MKSPAFRIVEDHTFPSIIQKAIAKNDHAWVIDAAGTRRRSAAMFCYAARAGYSWTLMLASLGGAVQQHASEQPHVR